LNEQNCEESLEKIKTRTSKQQNEPFFRVAQQVKVRYFEQRVTNFVAAHKKRLTTNKLDLNFL